MKNILNFLLEVNKLKEMPRTGWVLAEVKNPETIAEHIFGVTVDAWLLAEKRNLNVKRAIQIALSHDLCEVYAGDITPFLYYPYLPKDKDERKKILMKWARLLKREKEKIGKVKLQKEKKALLKLIKFLKPNLRNEILACRLGYEKGTLREGKFVKQLNRIDTLLQSIEYFGTKDINTRTNWWEWAEEIVDDPLLLEFLKIIQKKFYGKAFKSYKRQKQLEDILNFLLEIGKLKKTPRLYWTAHGIKNPETVAGHIFTVALMAWLLGKEKKGLDTEKLLKMALCHEISAVFTSDTIPYIKRLPRDERKRKETLRKWPRLPKGEKEKRFLRDYREERESLEKLTLGLEKKLKKEVIQLWDEYRRVSSPEGLFLNQVNSLAVLFQGLQYQKKYKGYFADPLWEWAFEKCDDPVALEFMEELKKKFY
jgi:putative hydrolase of HD superfamily